MMTNKISLRGRNKEGENKDKIFDLADNTCDFASYSFSSIFMLEVFDILNHVAKITYLMVAISHPYFFLITISYDEGN